MATMTDVHVLGSSFDDQREGICSYTMPLCPTRVQWLPYRGRDVVKTSFLTLPYAEQEISILKADVFPNKLTFLLNLPSVLFLPSYICKLLSFLSSSHAI